MGGTLTIRGSHLLFTVGNANNFQFKEAELAGDAGRRGKEGASGHRSPGGGGRRGVSTAGTVPEGTPRSAVQPGPGWIPHLQT